MAQLLSWSVPALLALVGAAVYLIAPNGKIAELGRIAFFAGLLAWLLLLRK